MGTFAKLYDWCERTFWHTLGRQLASRLALYAVNLGYLFLYFDQNATIAQALAEGQASAALATRSNASLDGGVTAMLGPSLVGLAWPAGEVRDLARLNS